MDYFPFHIWDVILPIDELHHFSAWLKPPTSHESHHRKSGKITKKYKQTKKTPENPEKIQKNPKKKTRKSHEEFHDPGHRGPFAWQRRKSGPFEATIVQKNYGKICGLMWFNGIVCLFLFTLLQIEHGHGK